MRLLVISLLSCFLMGSCANYGQLNYLAQLPEKLDENSGMVHLKDSTIWIVQDGGNSDKLYQVGLDGTLLHELKVKNAKNQDWEDLASDNRGNVYIGDFGNNESKRKDLVIYKVPNPEFEAGDKIEAKKIRFRYPDQTQFPPSKEDVQFDCEAMLYHKDSLYLITKDRSMPFSGIARIYRVPAKKGKYTATQVGTLTTCNDRTSCRVTAATISSDGKTIVLLGNGKLWRYSGLDGGLFSKATVEEFDLGVRTQLESVCFLDDRTLLLSDERSRKQGGNLYKFILPN